MTRRHAWMAAFVLVALAACGGEPATGPGPVTWDRDQCERCQMLLSDRSFASQVRTADGQLHRFDDVGCALLWAHEHAEGEPQEIWVRNLDGSDWLDARKARFVEGMKSPMGFGFGARAGSGGEGVEFETLKQQILAGADERRSHPR